MAVYLIIFGAAVRPDGSPSGSLLRRVEGAWQYSARDRAVRPEIKFLATGGIGRHGPAEAVIIRDLLLAKQVSHGDILLEAAATDTLESIVFCNAILSRCPDVDFLVVCTSKYHQVRCAVLLRLLGYKVVRPPMPPDRPFLGTWKWIRYVLKEFIALPYDVLLLLFRRASLRTDPPHQ